MASSQILQAIDRRKKKNKPAVAPGNRSRPEREAKALGSEHHNEH
jgi:hypothetical protein